MTRPEDIHLYYAVGRISTGSVLQIRANRLPPGYHNWSPDGQTAYLNGMLDKINHHTHFGGDKICIIVTHRPPRFEWLTDAS